MPEVEDKRCLLANPWVDTAKQLVCGRGAKPPPSGVSRQRQRCSAVFALPAASAAPAREITAPAGVLSTLPPVNIPHGCLLHLGAGPFQAP